jgi:hypothetical protein
MKEGTADRALGCTQARADGLSKSSGKIGQVEVRRVQSAGEGNTATGRRQRNSSRCRYFPLVELYQQAKMSPVACGPRVDGVCSTAGIGFQLVGLLKRKV